MTLNVFFSNLKYILQLSLVKFSVSLTFFRDWTGRTHGQTDGHLHGHMNRQTFLRKYYYRWTVEKNVFQLKTVV